MGVIRHFGPVPQYRRMMIFVDGENLVFRYQDMLSKGFIPHVHNSYEKDIFVWNQNSLVNLQKQHEILRATYYTYASGDDERLYDIKQKLKSLRSKQSTIRDRCFALFRPTWGTSLSDIFPGLESR